uniref:Uncharacterized protein n=1 Tax=Oncorhynchus tshawytscha TaxID=74940 RepID=A0AAZ3P399_ONCTS
VSGVCVCMVIGTAKTVPLCLLKQVFSSVLERLTQSSSVTFLSLPDCICCWLHSRESTDPWDLFLVSSRHKHTSSYPHIPLSLSPIHTHTKCTTHSRLSCPVTSHPGYHNASCPLRSHSESSLLSPHTAQSSSWLRREACAVINMSLLFHGRALPGLN